jgi:hypothetical protein
MGIARSKSAPFFRSRSAVSNPARRDFFKNAGAISLLSAFGGVNPHEANAQVRASGRGDEFQKPATLKSGAQLDSRFPVSFATSVSQGLRLVIEYFTALNQRDLGALAKTLHFPFAIYEEIEPIVVNSERELLTNPPPTLNATGKGKSRIAKGSYDLLESVNVHLYCPIGGVFSLSFARYTQDGNKLLDCDGIYSVTNNDGRWAIQLASTMFHERGFESDRYPDAEETHRIGSQGYLAAFGYRDEQLLNDLSKGRGSYEAELPIGTKRASVSFGYGPRERSRDAREGDPMKGWKAAGVKNRLQISEITAQTRERVQDTNLKEFVELAGGVVGEYDYTRLRPDRPLVIHATRDKAHTLGGYWRYTADGQLISETRGVGIRIYKGGHWGDVGNLGQVTHHDRSNSA